MPATATLLEEATREIWLKRAEPCALPLPSPWPMVVPASLLYLLPTLLGLFAPRSIPLPISMPSTGRIAFTFLDEDGNDVGHRGAVVGERLKLEDMPRYLPAAFIAMEDRRFYSHNGIDPRGLSARAVPGPARRHWVAGGSTISQQTAKIVYTDQQRTVSRKLTELMDAAGLEKSLSKKQILRTLSQPHLSGLGGLWRGWRRPCLFRRLSARSHACRRPRCWRR